MIFELIEFTFLFFVFLFTLFCLVRDDYILFRKNITIDRIFNISFLLVGVFLISARVFYILFNFSPQFLNPLVFLVVPYYPGLSITGGIIGATSWLFFYLNKKKITKFRIFDFFAISFFSSFVVYWILSIITTYIVSKTFTFPSLLVGGVALVLFLVIVRYFVNKRLKEGTSGFLTFIVFSFLTYLYMFMGRIEKNIFFFQIEDILVIGLFLASCIFFLREEQLLPTIRIWRRK